MVSRSSSAYQPLAQVAVGETVTPAVPRRNFSGHNAALRIQTVEDKEMNDKDNFEMTSIAIISKHPLRVGTTPTVTTLATHPVPGGAVVGIDPRVDLEISLCNLEHRRKDGSWNWTNFHFMMCIGVFGFLIFWFILLCRMYLPIEYQFWAKPKP